MTNTTINSQSVKSNESVQLDASNSRDVDGSTLNYSWDQIAGPEITLNHANSVGPTFTAPSSTSQINLTFQLIVTNEEGLASEPDQVTVTVSPISTSPPTEGPQTIQDIIKDLVKNPLDIANSIQLSKEIIDILTDNDRNNDQIACDLLGDLKNQHMNNIREIINCYEFLLDDIT